MLVYAKARLLPRSEASCLVSIAEELVSWSLHAKRQDCGALGSFHDDGLRQWFQPDSVENIRLLEWSIRRLLLSREQRATDSLVSAEMSDLSSLLCFFYVALLTSLKRVLSAFRTTNPTWMKTATSTDALSRIEFNHLASIFLDQVKAMRQTLVEDDVECGKSLQSQEVCRLGVASSLSLPLNSASVDVVMTSPPYCTRLDYAVATRFELSLLGITGDNFNKLRRELMGSATVQQRPSVPLPEWGETCNSFLRKSYNHSSYASKVYYHKNHTRYFEQLALSLQELARVTKASGTIALTVQDSYYKDIRNDLPTVCIEMLDVQDFRLSDRLDFRSNNKAKLHPGARSYRKIFSVTESLLIFKHRSVRIDNAAPT